MYIQICLNYSNQAHPSMLLTFLFDDFVSYDLLHSSYDHGFCSKIVSPIIFGCGIKYKRD